MTAHQVTQQFYTAAELAGLPDLPATVRGVQKLAERENWGWRERQGRGGGREYHKVWLPQAAKQALLERSFQRAGIVPADERAAAPAATVAPEAGDGEEADEGVERGGGMDDGTHEGLLDGKGGRAQ